MVGLYRSLTRDLPTGRMPCRLPGRKWKDVLSFLFFCWNLLLFSRSAMSNPLWPHDSSTPAFPVLHHFSELAQTHVHQVGDAIQPPHLLSSPSPPTFIFPSVRVFSKGLALHIRWPKYWSFNITISPFNEYLRLISFRIDWFDLLVAQGTLKNLLQHYSSKASILQHSVFFMVQLSHPYMTTRKIIALTIWTFVGKVMS